VQAAEDRIGRCALGEGQQQLVVLAWSANQAEGKGQTS